ncbi:unnamed protein product [Coccothraustes coccothraustes]
MVSRGLSGGEQQQWRSPGFPVRPSRLLSAGTAPGPGAFGDFPAVDSRRSRPSAPRAASERGREGAQLLRLCLCRVSPRRWPRPCGASWRRRRSCELGARGSAARL